MKKKRIQQILALKLTYDKLEEEEREEVGELEYDHQRLRDMDLQKRGAFEYWLFNKHRHVVEVLLREEMKEQLDLFEQQYEGQHDTMQHFAEAQVKAGSMQVGIDGVGQLAYDLEVSGQYYFWAGHVFRAY